ncbi:hypothetical protein OIU35_30280 [Boseaceae bacterium BT-24-1]|nr:hypothetical protein [Boseaceae bacterium BT-24-1]
MSPKAQAKAQRLHGTLLHKIGALRWLLDNASCTGCCYAVAPAVSQVKVAKIIAC